MMWKLLGAALMIASSAAAGAMLASGSKRRIEALEAALELVKYIKRNIEAYLTPVGAMLSSYSSEYLEKTGFGEAMRCDGLSAAFGGGYLELSGEAEEVLIAFAEKLGMGYADAEVKHCEYYIAELERLEASERERLSLNGRLYRFLPPLGALSLIILLL